MARAVLRAVGMAMAMAGAMAGAGMAQGTERQGAGLVVACRNAPPVLCALFASRVAHLHPGAVAGDADRAALRLVVTAQTPARITARIDRRLPGGGWHEGPAMGTARQDGPLDDDGLTRFLDLLIAQTPLR